MGLVGLPEPGYDFPLDSSVNVSGWGYLITEGDGSDVLMVVNVPVLTDTGELQLFLLNRLNLNCLFSLLQVCRSLGVEIFEEEFCAGVAGLDSCYVS